jgi:uncharacterized membrane protein
MSVEKTVSRVNVQAIMIGDELFWAIILFCFVTVLQFTHRQHTQRTKHKEHKMQTQKDSKSCQIISFADAKRERDDRKETESLTDFEITEENEAAELRLLQAVFPGEFETMVH